MTSPLLLSYRFSHPSDILLIHSQGAPQNIHLVCHASKMLHTLFLSWLHPYQPLLTREQLSHPCFCFPCHHYSLTSTNKSSLKEYYGKYIQMSICAAT